LDVSDVKTLLQIAEDDTSKDDYLEAVIPLLVDYAKDYCKQTFTEDEVEVLPGGVQLAIAKMAEFNMANVAEKSTTVGAYSTTLVAGTEYPKSITKLLRPYRQVKFV